MCDSNRKADWCHEECNDIGSMGDFTGCCFKYRMISRLVLENFFFPRWNKNHERARFFFVSIWLITCSVDSISVVRSNQTRYNWVALETFAFYWRYLEYIECFNIIRILVLQTRRGGVRLAALLSHFLAAQHVNPLACYMDLVALPLFCITLVPLIVAIFGRIGRETGVGWQWF